MERSSTKQIKGLETGLVYVGYSFQAYHVYSQSQCPLYQRPGASGALAGAGASAGDVRDMGSIPGFGRSPGGGHGHPLQCSCLENPMDREAWQAP